MLTRKLRINPGYLFVAPALLAIALVMLYPLVYTFYLSFYKSDIYTNHLKFVGFAQYGQLFHDNLFMNSLKATAIWTIGSVVFQFLFGFFAAIVLNQKFIKFKALFRILIMIPWVLPSIIGVSIWQWAYHPDFGIINYFLKSTGLVHRNIPWTTGSNIAIWSAVIVNIWKMFPFVMLMIEASLQGVPEQLKDAAKVDGSNTIRTFFTVTLPHISTTCYTIILLLTIWTLNAFTFIYALTGGGPAHASEVMSMFIYNFAFKDYNFGMASTASVVLFLIVSLFAVVYIKLLMKWGDNHE